MLCNVFGFSYILKFRHFSNFSLFKIRGNILLFPIPQYCILDATSFSSIHADLVKSELSMCHFFWGGDWSIFSLKVPKSPFFHYLVLQVLFFRHLTDFNLTLYQCSANYRRSKSSNKSPFNKFICSSVLFFFLCGLKLICSVLSYHFVLWIELFTGIVFFISFFMFKTIFSSY